MRKLGCGCVALGLGVAGFSQPASAQNGFTGNIVGLIGARSINKDDWRPKAPQFEYGGRVDLQPNAWPFGFTAGYFASHGDSYADSEKFSGSTREIEIGLKKIWVIPRIGRPYAGGGPSFGHIHGVFEGSSSRDDGVGGWIGGGFTYVVEHFAVGFDSRYSYIRTRPGNGGHMNAGGFQTGVTLGFAW